MKVLHIFRDKIWEVLVSFEMASYSRNRVKGSTFYRRNPNEISKKKNQGTEIVRKDVTYFVIRSTVVCWLASVAGVTASFSEHRIQSPKASPMAPAPPAPILPIDSCIRNLAFTVSTSDSYLVTSSLKQ